MTFHGPAEKVGRIAKPKVEIIYRDPSGAIVHKIGAWRHPTTDAALTEYIENYLSLVAAGYKPVDMDFTPIPHCARVIFLGKVMAEWKKILSPRFPSESPVTDGERLGRGGIPAASPSAPCSERLAVPTQGSPRHLLDSASSDRDPSNVARLGQATLTTG